MMVYTDSDLVESVLSHHHMLFIFFMMPQSNATSPHTSKL